MESDGGSGGGDGGDATVDTELVSNGAVVRIMVARVAIKWASIFLILHEI